MSSPKSHEYRNSLTPSRSSLVSASSRCLFDEDSTATGELDRPSSQGADCYLRRTEADLLAYSTCLKGCIAPQFPSR